jgi:hypothetical protein
VEGRIVVGVRRAPSLMTAEAGALFGRLGIAKESRRTQGWP